MKTLKSYQISTLLLTFAAYASFHASRKPPSIVKSVLGPPFHGPQGPHRLADLDTAFLSSYSLGMFLSGHLADRLNPRPLLLSGMLLSSLFTLSFGLAYFLHIQSLSFFISIQLACGLAQSVGWPCVISIIGNWFGKSKRGLIMGIWNSHTSVGNMVGSLLASSVLEYGWGWSFVLPSLLILSVGVVVFSLIVVSPEEVGLMKPAEDFPGVSVEMGMVSEESGLLPNEGHDSDSNSNYNSDHDAIGFLEAWRLPGVAPFAFCLFFSKLVAYTFLYWLPFYISHTAVAGVHLSHKTAGILSTVFDIGGVFGGIMAGYISDKIEARAVTSIIFLSMSIPSLIFYRAYGGVSMFANISLMFMSGLLVNGPYSLITTAVATDLGTQSSVKGNSRALATVTAIIDGTGSIGAVLGPLMTGYISTRGWNTVFFMLILSIFVGGMFLVGTAKAEIKGKSSQEVVIGSR